MKGQVPQFLPGGGRNGKVSPLRLAVLGKLNLNPLKFLHLLCRVVAQGDDKRPDVARDELIYRVSRLDGSVVFHGMGCVILL